jgi:hypothetical protein
VSELNKAICHRCGAEKPSALDPCPDCAFAPQGEDRAVALLFSDAWLNEAERAEAAARVRAGERPQPSAAQRRAVLGLKGPADALSRGETLRLALGCLLFSPLVAFAAALGWHTDRPAAAALALRVGLWSAAAEAALWAQWALG